MRFLARWTPLGGMWALSVENESRLIVATRRTDVPAACDFPGDEYLHAVGFDALPGVQWQHEPGGRWMPVVELGTQP